MKVALVHDWLTGMRGGEYVLERFSRMFPGAPIYTLVWVPGSVSARIESHPIRTSWIQHLPDAARRYRWYLPLFPRATDSLRIPPVDVVISLSHCAAKNVRIPKGAFHLSYVNTPMRYCWDLEHMYFPDGRFPWPLMAFVRSTCERLRRWDVARNVDVHAFIANSHNVADRIRRHYGREADVVYPSIDPARFAAATPAADAGAPYDLVVSAFAPNKRVDLAIEAANALGRRLVVVGTGQEEARLRRMAGPTVEFRGWASNDMIASLYAGARALLFPGEEDFGLVPVEAMASGCPVVAFGVGGVLETVARGADPATLARVREGGVARVPGGALFGRADAGSLADALQLLDREPPDRARLRAQAEPFAHEAFDRDFREVFERRFSAWRAGR